MDAPTNSFAPAPSPTTVRSTVPVPSLLSVYELTPVKSNCPAPSTLRRRLEVSFPAPPAETAPAYPVTDVASTRSPAPQYLPLHVALLAPVRAFTPITI